MTFNSKPEFHVGQIIVSDVCEGAPEGFLRWVEAIELNGDQWIVTTHQAALTEAIMQGKTQAGTDTTPDRVSLSDSDTASEDSITVLDGPEQSLTLDGAIGDDEGSDMAVAAPPISPMDGELPDPQHRHGQRIIGRVMPRKPTTGSSRMNAM